MCGIVGILGKSPVASQVVDALKRAAAFNFVAEEQLAEAHARKRLVTEEEVAQTIAFLASDLASGITGVTLPVDGGYLAAAGWRGFDNAVASRSE